MLSVGRLEEPVLLVLSAIWLWAGHFQQILSGHYLWLLGYFCLWTTIWL